MPEFRVTFGSQYPREPHPRFSLAHRDGWVMVVAVDGADARAFAVLVLGTAWCDLRGDGGWDPSWFPEGELARFVTPSAAGDATGSPVTEYGLMMSGGTYKLEDITPEAEAIHPIAARVAAATAKGWTMHRRKVIVVEDWGEAAGEQMATTWDDPPQPTPAAPAIPGARVT